MFSKVWLLQPLPTGGQAGHPNLQACNSVSLLVLQRKIAHSVSSAAVPGLFLTKKLLSCSPHDVAHGLISLCRKSIEKKPI